MGEIVDKAIKDWTTPKTTMPVIGAPIRFTFAKKAGNMRSSAAVFPVWAIVNCHPSSEPRQAMTASAMMREPTAGLNIRA